MSTIDTVLNTGQQAITNVDTSKIFIWNNRFENGQFTNATGSPITLLAGTLLGRIAATLKVAPLTSGATDGSQFPVGVLNETHTIEAGDTVTLAYCVAGDVAKEMVILQGSDTLSTVVSLKTIGDRVGSDTVGIKLVATDELTGFDNQ